MHDRDVSETEMFVMDTNKASPFDGDCHVGQYRGDKSSATDEPVDRVDPVRESQKIGDGAPRGPLFVVQSSAIRANNISEIGRGLKTFLQNFNANSARAGG